MVGPKKHKFTELFSKQWVQLCGGSPDQIKSSTSCMHHIKTFEAGEAEKWALSLMIRG